MDDVLAIKDTHTYYSPHPKLQPYIAHYTFTKPKPPYIKNLTIIPDASGCIVITIKSHQYDSFFWGPSKTVSIVNDDETTILQFFVEFLPGGASQLLGIPQNELADSHISLNTIHSKIDNQIKDILLLSKSLNDSIVQINHLLLNYLSTSKHINSIYTCLALLQDITSIQSVHQMSKEVNYSQRQLNRYFQKGFGMSLKHYIRIARINKAIKLFLTPLTLVQISQICGYYDQSHFNHDFKMICGVSPNKYIKNMANFYNETYKF